MEIKEIGGYFGLERFSGSELYEDAIPLNTGRNALLYLIIAKKIRKLYIPYYLCDCISDVCDRSGCEYEYYHIDADFRPATDKKPGSDEYIYIVNYFGRIREKEAEALKSRYGRVIFDNVQAFFQKPVRGMDTIYSCRKFIGVPDGAYLYTDVGYEPAETDRSADRMKHVLGRFEGLASDYYKDFQQSDEALYGLPLRYMSPLTHNLLRAVDYEAVSRRRKENCLCLQAALGKQNKIDVEIPDGPYCYPFYCENGTRIRHALAQKKIYVPTLWGNVLELENAGTSEKDYVKNILPIPCDQRYNRECMEYVAQTIVDIIK